MSFSLSPRQLELLAWYDIRLSEIRTLSCLVGIYTRDGDLCGNRCPPFGVHPHQLGVRYCNTYLLGSEGCSGQSRYSCGPLRTH